MGELIELRHDLKNKSVLVVLENFECEINYCPKLKVGWKNCVKSFGKVTQI